MFAWIRGACLCAAGGRDAEVRRRRAGRRGVVVALRLARCVALRHPHAPRLVATCVTRRVAGARLGGVGVGATVAQLTVCAVRGRRSRIARATAHGGERVQAYVLRSNLSADFEPGAKSTGVLAAKKENDREGNKWAEQMWCWRGGGGIGRCRRRRRCCWRTRRKSHCG
jgi:hypothetical protein